MGLDRLAMRILYQTTIATMHVSHQKEPMWKVKFNCSWPSSKFDNNVDNSEEDIRGMPAIIYNVGLGSFSRRINNNQMKQWIWRYDIWGEKCNIYQGNLGHKRIEVDRPVLAK